MSHSAPQIFNRLSFSPAPGITVNTDSKYLGSVRGRLGYSLGSVLVYGTAGYGFGNFNASFTGGGSSGGSESRSMRGLVFGGGVEAKLSQSISGRLEALHYGLTRKETDSGGFPMKSELDQTVVRAGITFHLN